MKCERIERIERGLEQRQRLVSADHCGEVESICKAGSVEGIGRGECVEELKEVYIYREGRREEGEERKKAMTG